MKTQTVRAFGQQAITPSPMGTYIRQAQLVPGVLPFSAATLWRKVQDGSFPKPIKLSSRITAWRLADIESWLESRHA